MHYYQQSNGIWSYSFADGDVPLGLNIILLGKGYSGHGKSVNNPADEAIVATGPIPKGYWGIEPPRTSDRLGPCVMNLMPLYHKSLGRSLFRIHGDSASHPGQASYGCIILPRDAREAIWATGDRILRVI